MPKAVLDSTTPQAACAAAHDQRTGEERSTRPGPPPALCNIFNCQTAEFHQPQLWSGLGFARLFSHSPKRGGVARQSRRQEKERACPGPSSPSPRFIELFQMGRFSALAPCPVGVPSAESV